MASTRKVQFPALIGLDTVETFREYIITWFADVATTYLINRRLGRAVKNYVETLCREAEEYVAGLKKKNPEACRDVPVILTPDDDADYFDLCKAVEMICDYSRGKVETYPLQPAFSLEFTEYVRSFVPQVADRTLKRKVVGIESAIQGLAVIGAHISRSYRGKEWGYVFIDVPNPEVIDFRKLSGMVARVASSVNLNDGGKLSFLVGAASAVALVYGKTLNEVIGKSQLRLESIRLTKSGRKVFVKAFDVFELSNLARRIFRLGVASPVYGLISSYPPREKRTLRSFVERLSKAIVICELHNEYSEMYAIMKVIESKSFMKEVQSYENWAELVRDLMRVRVPL
ncbi:MAG: hypothetical protein QXY43_06685 [Sulfolobales archaeon]